MLAWSQAVKAAQAAGLIRVLGVLHGLDWTDDDIHSIPLTCVAVVRSTHTRATTNIAVVLPLLRSGFISCFRIVRAALRLLLLLGRGRASA